VPAYGHRHMAWEPGGQTFVNLVIIDPMPVGDAGMPVAGARLRAMAAPSKPDTINI
jgi:hypothetical protein